MIERKSMSLHFIAMVVVCLLKVSVVAQDNCNCKCAAVSLNRNSVCQLLYQLRNELKNLVLQVENRTLYITQLRSMKAQLESHDELIRNLTSELMNSRVRSLFNGPVNAPEPSNLISGENIMSDLNETRRNVKNLEKELLNVNSFIESLDVKGLVHSKLEIMKETVFKDVINDLRNKVEGVVYRNETNVLNERLDSMENKLSNLIDFESDLQLSKKIENFRKALENVNGTIQEDILQEESCQNLLKLHDSKLKDLENLEAEVKILNTTIIVSQYGLAELRNNIEKIENKSKNTEVKLANLLIRSLMKERQKTKDQLEKFKTQLISKCSEGLLPCLPFQSNQTYFASNHTAKNYMLNLKDSLNRQVQGAFFYGCAPILPESFPSLVITRRDSDKSMTFSCTKGTTLVGITYTKCHEGIWEPDTPPVCVSESSYPSISECPEIKVKEKSALQLIVDESKRRILFKCSEDSLLEGPSFAQCTDGSWYPDSLPECVYSL